MGKQGYDLRQPTQREGYVAYEAQSKGKSERLELFVHREQLWMHLAPH